jgi:hypothetical protein
MPLARWQFTQMQAQQKKLQEFRAAGVSLLARNLTHAQKGGKTKHAKESGKRGLAIA